MSIDSYNDGLNDVHMTDNTDWYHNMRHVRLDTNSDNEDVYNTVEMIVNKCHRIKEVKRAWPQRSMTGVSGLCSLHSATFSKL